MCFLICFRFCFFSFGIAPYTMATHRAPWHTQSREWEGSWGFGLDKPRGLRDDSSSRFLGRFGAQSRTGPQRSQPKVAKMLAKTVAKMVGKTNGSRKTLGLASQSFHEKSFSQSFSPPLGTPLLTTVFTSVFTSVFTIIFNSVFIIVFVVGFPFGFADIALYIMPYRYDQKHTKNTIISHKIHLRRLCHCCKAEICFLLWKFGKPAS